MTAWKFDIYYFLILLDIFKNLLSSHFRVRSAFSLRMCLKLDSATKLGRPKPTYTRKKHKITLSSLYNPKKRFKLEFLLEILHKKLKH